MWIGDLPTADETESCWVRECNLPTERMQFSLFLFELGVEVAFR